MNPYRLKYSEVKTVREEMFDAQEGMCTLCNTKMEYFHDNQLVRPVLDHCHSTGRVRGVIHGDCNVLLGKIENFTKFKGKSMRGRLAQALAGVVDYMSGEYADNPLHPTHKSPQEKVNRGLMKKYRRLLRGAKKPTTKAKYQKLIKELK